MDIRLKSLYAVLIFLFWMMPYIWGMMFHRFSFKQWGRTAIWLFLSFVSLFVFLTFFEILVRFNTQKITSIELWGAIHDKKSIFHMIAFTAIVMFFQIEIWGLIWYRFWSQDRIPLWRKVAVPAFILSLILFFFFFRMYHVWLLMSSYQPFLQ